MEYKIGEFSALGKTTIKTLRFYEKEGLLSPSRVDEFTGYRYYDSSDLPRLAEIVALRQIGFGVAEIKQCLSGKNREIMLAKKRCECENELGIVSDRIRRIDYLLKEKNMDKQVVVKQIPSHTVYYKDGVLKNYADAGNFIREATKECLAANPGIRCVRPDYCFMSYLDGEYRETDVHVRYCQAVERAGKDTNGIKFAVTEPIKAACIYHRGSYDRLAETYGFIVGWIEKNGYKIVASIREMYIDGAWNQSDPERWLTEIQIPIE